MGTNFVGFKIMWILSVLILAILQLSILFIRKCLENLILTSTSEMKSTKVQTIGRI